MIYTITNGNVTAKISDFGAQLISLVGGDGYEYIWGADERYWSDHSPLLFPMCGRLLDGKYLYGGKEYKMNIHGFAKDSLFATVENTESSLTLELTANDETKAIYPFDFVLTAKYEVTGNTLSAKYTVKNLGDVALPYMLGWHPGFNLEGDAEIEDFTIEFDTQDARLHPIVHSHFVSHDSREYPFDNCKYHVSNQEIADCDTLCFSECGNRATLASAKTPHAVTLKWSENIPYFCIWKNTSRDARYVCLEPWSNIPDSDGESVESFETKIMSRLESGAAEEFCYEITAE